METDRYILALVVTGVLVGALFFTDAGITGYVPTAIQSQSLDITVSESQRFALKSLDEVKFSSLAVSGSIEGSGLVNIYLTDDKHRLLVHSNKRKRGSSMEQITGLMTLDIEPGPRLNTIESLPEGYETESGPFVSMCRETCVLDEGMFEGPVFLDVVVEPGTVVSISEIHFAS